MVNVKKERVVTKSYRIQAQILNFESIKVLWLNTYLPTDPLTIGQYDNTELLSVLEEVDSIFADNIFNEVQQSNNSIFSCAWLSSALAYFFPTFANFSDKSARIKRLI